MNSIRQFSLLMHEKVTAAFAWNVTMRAMIVVDQPVARFFSVTPCWCVEAQCKKSEGCRFLKMVAGKKKRCIQLSPKVPVLFWNNCTPVKELLGGAKNKRFLGVHAVPI